MISLFANSQGDRMRPVYHFRGLEIADWYFPPTNYVYVNQRYRWFMGMFDSGFHVPTTTVYPTLSAGQWTGAGGLKYRTTDSSFYGYSAYQWTRLASSQSVNQALANCYGLLNGLAVSYLSGLTFDVSPGDFTLGCFNFHSNGGQVTGTAAHGTLSRIDVVLVDTLGVVSILAGTPAADPSKPQVDPSHQLELTFYTVAALATTPTGVSSVNIYLNNAPEWTATQNNWTASVAADFNSTTDPFEGTKHILISNTGTVGPAAELKFVNGSVLNIGDYTVLKFYIKPVSDFNITQGIVLRLGNGTAFVSPLVPVRNGQFGFSRTLNSWQLITIPISAFNTTGTQFDRLYIGPISGAKNFYLDVIQLQSGITQPGPGTGIETDPLSIHLTGTSTLTGNITIDGSDLRDVAFLTNSFDIFANSTTGYAQLFALRPNEAGEGEIDLTNNNNTTAESGFTSIFSSVTDTLAEFTVFATNSTPTFTKGSANYGSFVRVTNRNILINPHITGGTLKITNLITKDDTTNYKPLARRVSDSTVVQFDHWPGGGGAGTVTDFIFTDANGFDGTVSTSTTTPTLSLITTAADDQLMYSNSGAIAGTTKMTHDGITTAFTGGSSGVYALSVLSITGNGLDAGSWNDLAGNFWNRFDNTTGIFDVVAFSTESNQTPDVGFGSQIALELESSTTVGRIASNIKWKWTTAVDADRVSQVEITTVNNEIEATAFTLKGSGQPQFNKLGDGTFTGTATKFLAVDVDGNVIEEDAPGGGGVNAGAALKATYYPSAGSTVDDWIGVEFGNTNINTKILSQATTEVGLNIVGISSQSQDLVIVENSGLTDLFNVQADGDVILSANMGIGTASPGSSLPGGNGLTVYGASGNVGVSINNNGTYQFIYNGGGDLHIYSSGNSTNNLTINSTSGNVGIGAMPTAALTVKAGGTAAQTAPIKLTGSSRLTTAEVGTIEYNSNFYLTKVNAVRFGVGGALVTNTTDVGNVGTGEDDLMTYSIPAGTLSADGDYVEFNMTFKFAANANNKQVKVKYGGTTFYASGAQADNDGEMVITGKIIRTGAAAQDIMFTQVNNGTLFTDLSDYVTATETLSGAVILKATGEATSNDDILMKILTIKYFPAN